VEPGVRPVRHRPLGDLGGRGGLHWLVLLAHEWPRWIVRARPDARTGDRGRPGMRTRSRGTDPAAGRRAAGVAPGMAPGPGRCAPVQAVASAAAAGQGGAAVSRSDSIVGAGPDPIPRGVWRLPFRR